MNQNEIRPGAVYRHFRNRNLYRVHALVLHSETLEEMVVYEALYDNPRSKWWARPRSMFLELVPVDGDRVPRFALVSED